MAGLERADLYWFESLSQAGTPDSRAVTPPPSRKFMETAFYGGTVSWF